MSMKGVLIRFRAKEGAIAFLRTMFLISHNTFEVGTYFCRNQDWAVVRTGVVA